MIKKLSIIVVVFMSIFCFSIYSETNASESSSYYDSTSLDPVEEKYTKIKDTIKTHGEGVVGNVLNGQEDSISWYVQKVLAFFLGITAILAVLVLIYGFIGIFSPNSDEGLQKSMKYIKGATIALLVIALSWLFVMLIFHVYEQAM